MILELLELRYGFREAVFQIEIGPARPGRMSHGIEVRKLLPELFSPICRSRNNRATSSGSGAGRLARS